MEKPCALQHPTDRHPSEPVPKEVLFKLCRYTCRVVPPVTRRHPHRPLRAQFMHKVPQVMVSPRKSSEPLGLRECKRKPAAFASAPKTSLSGRLGAPAISARFQ